MKKRCALLLILLALLLVVGIPTGLLVREYRRKQATHALLGAIVNNDTTAALAALKNGADPNTLDPDDLLPLDVRIGMFIDTIIHRNARDRLSNDLPLSYTALAREYSFPVSWRNPTIIKALLDAGGDPNCICAREGSSNNGRRQTTPLIISVLNNNEHEVKMLIDHGASVNVIDAFGCSALDCARDQENIKQVLRKAGAKTSQELDTETSG